MAGLVGREHELQSLNGLLDRAVADVGGALIVRGEAGIGKSALIEVAQRRARERGMAVLTARGVAAETLLPFGGLHQLVWSLLRDGALPKSARESLRAALGQATAVTPDFFSIAMAALELLVEAAEITPLLVVAEDAHWFDRPSADLLGFIARRIATAPIALLAAVRDGDDDPFAESHLPELRLGPLTDSCAWDLLSRSAPELPLELRERLLVTAAGNPLALIELPNATRAVGDDALAYSAVLPMNDRLERAFSARLPEMPPATRALLLAAAAEPSSTLGELLAVVTAVQRQDTRVDALDPAVSAGLVQAQGLHLRFRHPLVASAVYQSSTPSDRIAVHAALAEALASEPDRAVWHRVAAAVGSDPDVVADLRAFADRAARRGAASVAVTALERAAAFTDAAERDDLLLSAAELACETGQARERLPELLGRIHTPLSGLKAARRVQVESVLAPVQDIREVKSLAEQAERVWETDRDLAYRLLHAAAIRCYWGGAPAELRALVSGITDGLDPDVADPRSLLVHGYASPFERSTVLLRRAEEYVRDPRLWRRRFGVGVFGLVGEFPRAVVELGAVISLAREAGQVLFIGRILVTRAGSSWHSGDWDAGTADALEAERIGRELLEPALWLTGRLHGALFGVCRGDVAGTEQTLAESLADPAVRGNRAVLALAQLVRAIVSLVEGRPAEALERLLRTYDPSDEHHHSSYELWSLANLAEAALAARQQDRARAVLDRLERRVPGEVGGATSRHLAYARALLADEHDADELYKVALHTDLDAWPFLRARLNLAYGRHLRRKSCITDARAALKLAADLFDQLGAIPWLQQALSELRAAGEKAPELASAPVPGPTALTAQELRIAQLAAEGHSNREIGYRLFLSPRTVGSHLYKIFPKLGITRRSQLSGALRHHRDTLSPADKGQR